jgi:choline dehydrogenase-like flavoprotein
MILAGDALPQDRPTEADVAIVGAGAVGVALVTRLAGRVGRIALIEAGGPRYEVDQHLNFFKADEITDRRHPPTEFYRRRMLGGDHVGLGRSLHPIGPRRFHARPWEIRLAGGLRRSGCTFPRCAWLSRRGNTRVHDFSSPADTVRFALPYGRLGNKGPVRGWRRAISDFGFCEPDVVGCCTCLLLG